MKYLYKNKRFILKAGMGITAKVRAQILFNIECGTKCYVEKICGNNALAIIYITAPTPEGICTFELTPDRLFECFVVGSNKHIIAVDYNFKGRNLKGMECELLADIGKYVMVEMDEDVGGISCDGLGKKGHCIPISLDILKTKQIGLSK